MYTEDIPIQAHKDMYQEVTAALHDSKKGIIKPSASLLE